MDGTARMRERKNPKRNIRECVCERENNNKREPTRKRNLLFGGSSFTRVDAGELVSHSILFACSTTESTSAPLPTFGVHYEPFPLYVSTSIVDCQTDSFAVALQHKRCNYEDDPEQSVLATGGKRRIHAREFPTVNGRQWETDSGETAKDGGRDRGERREMPVRK